MQHKEFFNTVQRFETEVFRHLMAEIEELEEKYPESIVENAVKDLAEEVNNQ